MGFEWIVSPTQAFPAGVQRYTDAINAAVYELCQYYQPEIQNWMQENAPWVDRTANARQGLFVNVSRETNSVTITLGHGVIYGKYLEFKNPEAGPLLKAAGALGLELGQQGKFAVIGPALDEFGPKIFADVKAILS